MGKETERIRTEFSSKLEIGGNKYTVVTGLEQADNIHLVSNVYSGDKVVATSTEEYDTSLKGIDAKTLRVLIGEHHRNAISTFREAKLDEAKTPSEYIKETQTLLAEKKNSEAMKLLKEAVKLYPVDPFVLSYYGCLTAIVKSDFESGIEACKRAMKALDRSIPFGKDTYYPYLFLNLGRAYIAAGNKSSAIDSIKSGLKIEPGNADLQAELKALGVRKKPVIPFLKRSHPINKYIGRMLHKARNK